MNRRRAAGPSRMSCRSSGQKKTVFSTALSSEALLAGTLLTAMCFFLPNPASNWLRKSLPLVWMEPARRKPASPKRTSSRSDRVRWDFPVDRHTMASSRLVFPWAFSPQMTLHTGSKSTRCPA